MSWTLRLGLVVGAAGLAVLPSPAFAHDGSLHGPGEIGVTDVLAGLSLTAAAMVYAQGYSSLSRDRPHLARRLRQRAVSFYTGLAVMFFSLTFWMEQASHLSVAVHMIQHLLLIQVAAPLIVLGAPITVMSALFRREGLPRLGSLGPRAVLLSVSPVFVFLAHTVALMAWHLPALHNRSLDSTMVHIVQHATFFSTALLFWYVALPMRGSRTSHAPSLSLLLLLTLVTGALGALMTLASSPWYAYPINGFLAPLEDQQLAGAVMWVVGGMLYAVTAAVVFLQWLSRSEKRALV